MKRKVIKQANQAYTITLPIDWVRKNNIDKNSELDLQILGKNILIHSGKPISGKSIKVDVSGCKERIIYMHLIAAYAQGADEIELTSKEDISAIITRSLNATIGYALISQNGNSYLIKDINPGNHSNLDDIFKRVFQMILLFFEAAIKDIFGKKTETLESLKSRDSEVNKFCLYLQRAINKMSYEDQIKGRIVFTYSFALEKISDEIERAWRSTIKNNFTIGDEVRKLAEMSKEGLEKAFDLYYQFNKNKIEEIFSIREKVREKALNLKKSDPNLARFVRHIVKIVEDAADLNHLALMKQL